MPGNREVDRAAVQFGAFSLNGTGEEDVDGDREEPEKGGSHSEQGLEDPQTREEVKQHVGRQERLGVALVDPLGISHYYSVWHRLAASVWQWPVSE